MSAVITGSQNGTVGLINAGTAVASTSGTSIDFTGIPAGVKRITVMFNGVSTNGTSTVQIQLGDSSGVKTTGYTSAGSYNGPGNGGSNSTTGLIVIHGPNAVSLCSGICTLALISGSTWVSSSVLGRNAETYTQMGGGVVALSGTLDRVRITTVNGTDTFDAGSINILYE